jgi:cephalosporin-C deacetylase-like acetyl esterase
MVFLLILAMPAALAAAGRAGEVPRAMTTSDHRPDGSLVVTAPGWRATVGADGNLHSFQVGETELLDDRVGVSLGGFLYSEGPVKLGSPVQTSPTIWEATGQGCAIEYRFTRREIRISLRNTGSKALTYFVVLSADTVITSSAQPGEAAASPATEGWSDVRFLTAGGAYIELLGGTRIWGPWLDRQVWEVSRIAPGESAVVRVRGAVGEPPQATLEQLVGLTARTSSPDAMVPADRPMEVLAEVENRSDRELSGQESMELSGCRNDLLVTATSALSLPAKQSTSTLFKMPVQLPDFYTARVVLTVEGRAVGKAVASAGYRVAEIRPAVTKPDDFKQFWQRLVAEVGSEPPVCRMEPDAQHSREGIAASVVEYEGLGGKKIYGWYLRPGEAPSGERPDKPSAPRDPSRSGVPRPEGRDGGPPQAGLATAAAEPPLEAAARYPAILYLPVYGARPVSPPMALAKGGYVVLALDVRGNRVDVPRPRAFEDYCTLGIESPDSYVYRDIVGQCMKAVRLLAAREEVDRDRIAVVGMSEGGGIGLILAALSPEVRAVAADAPLLCDLPLSVQAAGWPYTGISRYVQEHPKEGDAVRKTLSYYDVASFAPDIKCPVLMTVGFLDQVSLPAAAYGVFNLLPGPKEMKPLPRAGHEGGGEDLWNYKLTWLAQALGHHP